MQSCDSQTQRPRVRLKVQLLAPHLAWGELGAFAVDPFHRGWDVAQVWTESTDSSTADRCKAELSSFMPAFPCHAERLGMEDCFRCKGSIHLYLIASIDFQFHICWTVATGHIKIHHRLHCTFQFRLPPPLMNQSVSAYNAYVFKLFLVTLWS